MKNNDNYLLIYSCCYKERVIMSKLILCKVYIYIIKPNIIIIKPNITIINKPF